MTVSLYSQHGATLTPHVNNGTLWTKGFAIGRSIYIIDRESSSPHAFWKFDLDKDEAWKSMAAFPGTKYGLTGAANGKGYASSYASNKFWEYDPAQDKWTPLEDLPFAVAEIHWVEYGGKYYVPSASGVFEFNASTKGWTKITDEGASVGAIYRIDDDLFFYNINNDHYYQFNLISKELSEHDLPDNFGWAVSFNAPFTLGNKAYTVISKDLWIFDKATKEWSMEEDALAAGCHGDDVFMVDGEVYLVSDGSLFVVHLE